MILQFENRLRSSNLQLKDYLPLAQVNKQYHEKDVVVFIISCYGGTSIFYGKGIEDIPNTQVPTKNIRLTYTTDNTTGKGFQLKDLIRNELYF
ncbi:unnamed protein product [Didymodactylos carnosus]|uniref:Uncharacterized protein n=1 Tax=Didymodactylos carnosus TaxID=1234261 RepID=A0A814BU74_9BILA|nr:unnamed protein product [Didymodactylos carnosus]CAF1099961.1 unnamed protein product [Didymodactylos carnosus]CAF3711158.1 unnamed protein product [Didymodactylos carnosus]CAF3861412.1 unnamed protein product [Didymodactylos carnosus]